MIPVYGKIKYSPEVTDFTINYNAGVRMMNSDSYLSFSVYPFYKKNNFSLGGNIEFYYGTSSGMLDNWDDVPDLVEKIYFRYSNQQSNNKLKINAGKLNNITFGHGYLVKNLSNAFNYPYQRNFGVNLFYELDRNFFKFQFFAPSIREYFNKGGILGFHSSLFISHKFPLSLGFGLIFDLNQFALSDNTYNFSNQNISDLSRSVSAIEIDYNYQIIKTMNLELNLYGEFVGIWYPDKIYYLQIDGSPYTDDVRWREGTWGMLGPGISATINNRYNFKFAFNLNSAGFQPEYFNTNYLNNRAIYYNASDEDLEFPLITEFGYTYKNIVDMSALISLFVQNKSNTLDKLAALEIGSVGTYYSIGANISIKDNVLKNVSFLDFYLSNVFFWSIDDIDKMLYGVKMGFKLPLKLILILDVGQVFYDYNLVNEKKKMLNAGIEIKMDF